MLIAIARRVRPEEGTLAIKKCLFDMPQEESGWYYGSDAVRSPLDVYRGPGDPPYESDTW